MDLSQWHMPAISAVAEVKVKEPRSKAAQVAKV
jgi:hypothetical protein